MSEGLRLIGSIVISAAIIIIFVYLYALAMWRAWRKPAEIPTYSQPYVYVATALAGLVGMLVAAGFNQQLPEAAVQASLGQQLPGAIAGDAITQTAEEQLPQDNLQAVGTFVLPKSPIEWQQLFSIIYTLTYFVLAIFAIITWISPNITAPDFVKSLASIALTLMLAVGRSFFGI